MNTDVYFLPYLAHFFLERQILQTNVVQNLKKKHILCSVTFFPEYLAVYEIMCANIVERSRPQMTIWRMSIAFWIPKATHTHKHTLTICNTHSFSTATMVARTRLHITL